MNEAKPAAGLVLVTGGAKSGKSRFAEHYAGKLAEAGGGERVYVATAEALDEEMRLRAERHRRERGAGWRTIEAPRNLEAVLASLDRDKPAAVLVDCVTIWLANLLLQPDAEGREQWRDPAHSEAILDRVGRLAERLKQAAFPAVLVTNEVGDSLVPDNPLGRVYRDLAGQANQRLAAQADDVFWVVCGIPVSLRGAAYSGNPLIGGQ